MDNCAIFGYEDRKDFPSLTIENIVNGKDTEIAIIHYTGSSRRLKLIDHNYGDILKYFGETFYKGNRWLFFLVEFNRVVHQKIASILKKVNYKIKQLIK